MLPLQQVFRLGVAAASLALVTACSGSEASHDHDHGSEGEGGHVHTAKLGGTLVELGDHFANMELTNDMELGEIVLYIWDAHAEHSAKSSTEAPKLLITPHSDVEAFTMTLAPRITPTSKNKVGASSSFVGQHDSLKGLDHFSVKVEEISVKGKTFTPEEFLHPADAHDHGHDEEGGHEEGDGHDHEGDDHDHEHAEGDGHDHDGDDHDHDHEESDG